MALTHATRNQRSRKAAKRDHRRQMLYIRDTEQDTWNNAALASAELGLSLSVFVTQALRDYKPFRIWQAQQNDTAA